MTSRPIRRLKPVIYPILFFFCWTNLGIYNIAYAASSGASQESGVRSQKNEKSAEEKFQETLERLRDAVGKEDSAKIKAERVEIEKLDVEIKKQFKETEEKIKDLPEEIKQRHRDFLKKYEENLSTLKGHLDRIEKAKSKSELKVEVEKAKAFLEKTKPPKRHVPLDPNKLPHRTVEPKFKEPRTKPEEFEKQNTGDRSQKTVVGWASPTNNVSPILVAANGPLTGLVSSLPRLQGEGWGEGGVNIHGLDNAPALRHPLFSKEGVGGSLTNTLLALNTTDLPTSADLAETIEVQFTDDIKAKAAELNYNPVKIYEWVRNNIDTSLPTAASRARTCVCKQSSATTWTRQAC